jgi:hypothetical protein
MESLRISAPPSHHCDASCPTSHPVLSWLRLGGLSAVPELIEHEGLAAAVSIGTGRGAHTKDSSPIDRLAVDLLDDVNEDILIHVDSVLDFLATHQGQQTIVHCMHGKSRSVSLLAACVMLLTGCAADEALAFLYTCRPCVGVHGGFYAQLKILESVLANNTTHLPPPLGFSTHISTPRFLSSAMACSDGFQYAATVMSPPPGYYNRAAQRFTAFGRPLHSDTSTDDHVWALMR